MVKFSNPKVAVFAFDIREASQIRRIRSLIELGCEITSYSMRRQNMNLGFVPSWRNYHLGEIENGRIFRRLIVLVFASFRIAKMSHDIAQMDRIIARNFDMLLLALVAKSMTRLRSRRSLPVVYECLDIHSIFIKDGIRAKFARLVERTALIFVDRIIVSAPAFRTEYFERYYGSQNDIRLVENKLVLGTNLPARVNAQRREMNYPLRIGLVGTIRCKQSVALLFDLAAAFSDRYEIHLHGVVHRHTVPDLELRLSMNAAVFYHGPYDYPADLEKIYHQLDFIWAQDLWQMEGNSRWLLPNRIYEAGYFGCPAIALEHTETGRVIREMGTGITCQSPTTDSVHQAILATSPAKYHAMVQHLSQLPARHFVLDRAELSQFLA